MLVLFEMNEYAMYRMDEQLRELFPEIPVASVVGDIKNARRVNQVMHQYSPALVFHAAAYKHVPLMEEPTRGEAVATTCSAPTCGASRDRLRREALRVHLHRQAVNPANVMGATKRLAEMVCQRCRPRRAAPRASRWFASATCSAQRRQR